MKSHINDVLLVVEDSAGYAELLAQALAEHGLIQNVVVVPGIEAAWTFLEGRSTGSETPRLILLDHGLRDGKGEELLQRVRSTPRLMTVPVVMLTSSADISTMQRCYANGANAFVIKPDRFSDLMTLVGDLADFWLRWNQSRPVTTR